MARSASSLNSRTTTLDDLETWVNGDPPFDDDCRRLLLAYRVALSQANAQGNTDEETNSPNNGDEIGKKPQFPESEKVTIDVENPLAQETFPSVAAQSSKMIPQPPRVRFVPRLAEIEGIQPDQLGWLHGQLLAMGYLSEELLGRTGGIAYRVTRDGICRLNQAAGDEIGGGERAGEAGEPENHDSRAA